MHVEQLYLDLNAFFASVEQQKDPSLRGYPVAVIPTATETTCCIAVSYEAKVFGIKTGTAVWRARELCPHIALLPARHDVYVSYHQRIHDEVRRHVPEVAVCSIDEFTTTLGGRDRELPAALELARRIKQGIRENIGLAITSSIGLAPNRLLAKIAGDMQKPDGLTWILSGEIKEKLAPLALEDLPGIGKGNLARLHRAGVNTVSALLDLDPRHARAIWRSVTGERFLRALQGGTFIEPKTQRRQLATARFWHRRTGRGQRHMRWRGYCLRKPHAGCGVTAIARVGSGLVSGISRVCGATLRHGCLRRSPIVRCWRSSTSFGKGLSGMPKRTSRRLVSACRIWRRSTRDKVICSSTRGWTSNGATSVLPAWSTPSRTGLAPPPSATAHHRRGLPPIPVGASLSLASRCRKIVYNNRETG